MFEYVFFVHDELLHACRINVEVFVHEVRLFGHSKDAFEVIATRLTVVILAVRIRALRR